MVAISSALLFVFASEAKAQLDVSLEYNSRYVWRGFDFGNSPSLMPEIAFSYGGFEIGAWAAYATNGNPAGTEIDFFVSYTFETNAGDFSLSLTDYTFPDEPVPYFEADAHFLELGFAYETMISENTGIGLSTGVFIHNDDDNALYHEVSLTQSLSEADLSLFAGFTSGEAAIYETTGFAFINVGGTVSKEFTIGSGFPLGISASLISNPHAERMFFVFGTSIGF